MGVREKDRGRGRECVREQEIEGERERVRVSEREREGEDRKDKPTTKESARHVDTHSERAREEDGMVYRYLRHHR